MFNRFKNALYGPSCSSDDSSVGLEYGDYKDATLGKKIRGALMRSSSFREDLLSEMANNRDATNDDQRNSNGNSNGATTAKATGTGGIQSGISHLFRKHNTIPEDCHPRLNSQRTSSKGEAKVPKYRYTRPKFLQLRTDDEIIVSADHQIRPIILPRDVSSLPWKSGYAECINAGKSARNEDQAACHQEVIIRESSRLRDSTSIKDQIPWTYFGIFDGHAGTAVAIAAAAQLHHIIHGKLCGIADLLIALEFGLDEDDDEDDDDDNDDVDKDHDGCDDDGDVGDHSDDQADDYKFEDEFADCVSSPSTTKSSPRLSTHSTDAKHNEPADEVGDKTGNRPPEARAENGDNSSLCDSEQQGEEAAMTIKSETVSKPSERKRKRRRRFSWSEVELRREWFALPRMVDLCRSKINVDSLITGLLESAFWEMDGCIGNEKQIYKMAGGCTALVSVFILGKLYVCNAGDSRAIIYKNGKVVPMSFDFTPTSERERILRLGLQRPELMGNEFTQLEFLRRPGREDVGNHMLYKDAYMTGWCRKRITCEDLKFPLVWGVGKRSRVLATIGVTRGFGDHELCSQFGSVPIKPFLTPEPEVRVLDLKDDADLTAEDVLIMGSDGLWDVTSNEEAAEVVKRSFDLFPDNEESRSKYRYITAAQDLIIHSRGNWDNVWRTADDRLASLDDISAFVVPLKPYRDEYLEWKKLRSFGGSGSGSGAGAVSK